MILFNKFKIVLISSAFLCLCPVLGYADVSCPSGYVKISESDSIIVTNSSSCPSGHTKLSDMSGGTSVTNCTTGLSSGFCTYYSETCQSGKYFDGTTHKTCIAGSYCDGSGTATPGVSGCSKACPENSTSTSGATKCTCNAGYYLDGNECVICPLGSYCANNTKTACDTGYTTDNTGSTSKSQCYTTCEVACTQQTCPDNATCTHGATVTTGKQYVGGTCDAEQTTCELNITCDTGYELKDGACTAIVCESGYYLDGNECVICPLSSYCANNTKTACDTGYTTDNTGASTESQCYTTCEVACTQQTCPDNATCTHGTTTTTGKQYVGSTCDASASQCEIAVTCNSGYVLSDGECVQIEFEPEFTITTTKLSADTTFRFTLAAAGTFYINWGDGNIKVIEKTTVAEEIIEHAYADSGTYNIGIAGDAVGYNTGINISSIRFSHDTNSDVNGWKYIAGIDGSLGAIFGTLKNPTLTSQTQPRFRYTFSGCTNLTSAIPLELFNGIYGAPVDRMFMGLFNECSKMSGTLPSELFADLSGQITENMFRQSFNSCAGLTGSIPADFFGGLSGELRNSSLYRTFYGCSQLSGYIEPGLFANFTESSDAPSQMSGVFTNTGLDTVCPANTYNYDNVFNDYFDGRVSCSPCPNNGLSVSAENSEISACYLDAICSDVGQGTQQCNYNTITDEYTDCTTCIYTSCNSGYELVDGACEMISFEPEFTITTTEIPANTEFTFNISAAGTYYIDWGDGTIEPIEKTNLTNTPYSHTYELKGTYEIKLAGQAIGYNSDVNTSAIDFSGNTYIAGIDGSLGAIFGTLENPTFNTKTQPRFRYTFSGCTNLTSAIPPELFSGIYGAPTDRMFMAMFSGCSKLSGTLPANLFAGMSGQITENMFRQMFYGCSSLSGPIPSGLFGDLSGQLQTSSFLRTFSGCTSLDGYIPPDLFAKFTRPSTMSGQMTEIFYNTKLDTACPVNMYQYKTGYEEFFNSHVACTPCPDGYSSESGSTSESQCYTTCEVACSQQTCPDNATCTHGATVTTGKQYVGGTCDAVASQCELTVNCATGYELTNGTCSAIVCESGYYLDGNECIICPIGSYCTNNTKTACDTGYNTDNTGATSESQCYTTCEVACTQQACPDNATCTHGTTTTTGKQYVGGTCDAVASQCELTVNCATGYELTNGTCSAIVCESGYYLDGNECIICPIGSYCANNTKTACDTGYNTDNTGATSESQCYTTCEVACTQQTCPDNATCTHGTTTTTGKQYVGGTCDAEQTTCELNITCDTGYELKDGTCSAIVCEPGYYLDGNECIICPIGSYCANNTKTACDTGYNTDNTGASTESQCYTTCEVACTQQTCPENAICTHGTTTTTGKQYVGGTCDAEQTTCEVNFKCNENFELIDGECKFKPEFTITTINMSDDTTFMFALSAAGNYVIDWGDGNVELINKTDTARESVWHTYKKGGIYTIGLSGQATKYSDVKFIAAIDFGNNTAEVVEANAYKYIAAIDGGLGAIFSGNTANMFYKTFSGCSHLTTVPKTLFDGVTGSAEYMFANTFFECTNLKTLPENLFAGLYGSAEHMFHSTFARCSALENIPKDLFATISGNASNLFSNTFSYCSALRSIPEELFGSLSGNAMYMFEYTFLNCTSLTEIPKGLFASLSGGATGMFAWTFGYCRNLTSIPSELFATITDSWENMFYLTFAECTSLQSIPDGLFKNITGKPKYQEFDGVFRGCTNLSGYIPVDMFEKLDGTDFNNSSMWGIFDDTKLAESCPANMYQIITGFESAWSNKVMCGTCPDGTLSIAGSVGIESCKKPEPVEVVITTTEMQPNSEFWFYISASGTFFVDWGDGTIELIERPELSINQYKHKYLAPGVYKIGLSGSATGYADNYCVGFMGNQYVNEVDGSLIDVFGILSDGTNPKFTYSFASCSNLSKISKDLFAGYNGGTEQMFSSTFTSTYSLKEIPEGLFDSITTAAPDMFDITFASSGLTSLPSGMFKNITGKPEPNMFRSTFAAVNDLQGYVPANMFENMDSVDYESGPMTAIFYGTNLAEQCPENMYQYKTGFEVDWSDKVACTPCPDGTTSNVGASGIDQCIGGKTLHIGDEIQMNLTTVKPQTARVMVFDVLGDLYYGGLSETAKPINKNTDKQFRIYDPESNQNYWMHDYTVQ